MAQTFSLSVTGMTCASCVGRAQKAIEAVGGVQSAAVNLANETATVQLNDRSVLADVTAALNKAGYPAREQTIRLSVEGMTCASCVGRVEKAALSQAGVVHAAANLANETLQITLIEGVASVDGITAAIKAIGYTARATDPVATQTSSERKTAEATELRGKLILAAVLTLPVFVVEMGGTCIRRFITGSCGPSGRTSAGPCNSYLPRRSWLGLVAGSIKKGFRPWRGCRRI